MNSVTSPRRVPLPLIVALLASGLLAACNRTSPPQEPQPAAPAVGIPCGMPLIGTNTEMGAAEAALIAGIVTGESSVAGAAIERGANVNVAGALKRTPLFFAAFCDRPGLVKTLLEKGAKPDLADANGMLPLHAAIVVGSAESAKLLLAGGANINGRDPAERTALHLAAATNQKALVDLLLAGKANAAVRDKSGKTAEALARDNGHSATADAIKAQEKPKAPRAK